MTTTMRMMTTPQYLLHHLPEGSERSLWVSPTGQKGRSTWCSSLFKKDKPLLWHFLTAWYLSEDSSSRIVLQCGCGASVR